MLSVLVFASAVTIASSTAAGMDLNDVNNLAFLAGTWRSTSVDDAGVNHVIESHYAAPSGGLVLGQSRFVDADETSFFEFETFTVQNGVLLLTPSPFGTPGVSFTVAAAGPASIRFENLAHDFPRVVEYRLTDNGDLYSKAEGIDDNNAPRVFEYVQKRVAP